MKILISTPIYKKEGGPAKYAEILFNEFSVRGIKSKVVTYGKLIKFPTGIRHILYFFKIIPNLVFSNVVLSLDYYSAGWSSFVASKIFRKKHIIRVGGDFLWELYLERTKKEIYLSEFYSLIKKGEIVLNTKEKVIFNLSKFVLNNSDALVFPNEWLKQIFKTAYGLDKTKLFVIENEYENSPKRNIIPKDRVIFSPSRNIFLKNKAKLFEAMDILKDRFKDLELDITTRGKEETLEFMKKSYCVVVPSVSEVSPNLALEALSLGIPTILTKDCGINDRVGDLVVSVDPRSALSIAEGIEKILSADEYNKYMAKISKFDFTHSKEEICDEFLDVINMV